LPRNCNKKQENSFTFAAMSTFVGLWAVAHIGILVCYIRARLPRRCAPRNDNWHIELTILTVV